MKDHPDHKSGHLIKYLWYYIEHLEKSEMLSPVDPWYAPFSHLGEMKNHKNVKEQLQIDKGKPDDEVVKNKGFK